MQQASQTSDQPDHYQRNGHTTTSAAAATYEEKVKAMNFDAESDSSDSEPEATEWQRRNFAVLAVSDDGRQRSRIVTHPVLRPTTAMPMPPTPAVAVAMHPIVRTRPASPSAFSTYLTASSLWSAQSAVARRAAASRRGFQQQREVGWRPNSMDFDAEVDSSDCSDAECLPEPRQRYNHHEEDSRHRSRVITRPVVRSTMVTGHNPTATVYAPVRTRPVSPSVLSSNNLTRPVSPSALSSNNLSRPVSPSALSSNPRASSHWSTQSAVARKAASNQKNPKKPKKQRQQQPTEQQGDPDTHRPRSSSESSFGRLFFGWRRPQYSKQEAAAAAAAAANEASRESPPQQQPVEYGGKNVHNFSYVDAKIYSPQSQQLQQQQQQQQQQQGTNNSRTQTRWTMETMGAVNSAYSNQFMLAREAPTTSAAFPG